LRIAVPVPDWPDENEGQSMKVFVTSICALLVGSSIAVAQDIKDFDLACAVTASAVVASSPKGAVERDTAMWLWSFYLGRLSGRDDKTFWAMVIKGRLAELREKPKSKELLYGKCMEFYTAKMTDRMTE
jgi:hypothetical protein